jgi:hypothetical protein
MIWILVSIISGQCFTACPPSLLCGPKFVSGGIHRLGDSQSVEVVALLVNGTGDDWCGRPSS